MQNTNLNETGKTKATKCNQSGTRKKSEYIEQWEWPIYSEN